MSEETFDILCEERDQSWGSRLLSFIWEGFGSQIPRKQVLRLFVEFPERAARYFHLTVTGNKMCLLESEEERRKKEVSPFKILKYRKSEIMRWNSVSLLQLSG